MDNYNFHSINGLIRVVPSLWNTGCSDEEILKVLYDNGFEYVDVNITKIARSVLSFPYINQATLSFAPNSFNCSTFTRWVYGHLGIELPVYSLRQRNTYGSRVSLFDVMTGDLVFRASRRRNRFDYHPEDQVGHVGLVVDNQKIIHASFFNDQKVVEESIHNFCEDTLYFRGCTRIIPENSYTLKIPQNVDIIYSDDVFQLLKKYLKW